MNKVTRKQEAWFKSCSLW